MDQKETEKVKNRIAFLKLEYQKNNDQILKLSQENQKIRGGITELNMVLANLAPEKKGEET